MTNESPGLTDHGLLVLVALIWGSSFMFIKIAVPVLGPAGLTLFRLVVAALALILAGVAISRGFQKRKSL